MNAMAIKEPCLVRLVYTGDSITFGQYVDPKIRWTSLVDNRLTQQYSETPVHIFMLNKSGPGDTTRMGLEAFPANCQRTQPDVLFIDFGMNDCNCWSTDHGMQRVSEPAFRANLYEMIARGRRFGAKRIILPTKTRSLKGKLMLSGQYYEEANARYCQIIREVAADTGVIAPDPRKAFEALSVKQLEEYLLPYPDHIHLSPAGHVFYADFIYPFVDKAIKEVIQEKAKEGKLI
jgi:lysophospholipase L1-like esterase